MLHDLDCCVISFFSVVVRYLCSMRMATACLLRRGCWGSIDSNLVCVFGFRMVSGPRAIFEKKICYVIVAYDFFLLLCLLRAGSGKIVCYVFGR